MICCIILNYNDSDNVIVLVEKIKQYKSLNYILIVDNCSTDDSFSKLNKVCSSKVHLIKAKKNGGYGYGNNLGVNYAYQTLKCDKVLISNPDVDFSEKCIEALINGFESIASCAIIAPIQLTLQGKVIKEIGWKIPIVTQYIFSELYCYNKIFTPLLYSTSYFVNQPDYCKVDCVPGSLLLVDAAKFIECGGYDPDMFLYCEETTLGYKMKHLGYGTYIVKNYSYIHIHSVSINKAIPREIMKKKLLLQSKMIFLKKYYKISKSLQLLTKVIYGIALIESYVLIIIRKLYKYGI